MGAGNVFPVGFERRCLTIRTLQSVKPCGEFVHIFIAFCWLCDILFRLCAQKTGAEGPAFSIFELLIPQNLPKINLKKIRFHICISILYLAVHTFLVCVAQFGLADYNGFRVQYAEIIMPQDAYAKIMPVKNKQKSCL